MYVGLLVTIKMFFFSISRFQEEKRRRKERERERKKVVDRKIERGKERE